MELNTEENFMNTLKQLRNFGIAAHIDAGKTTVSERILFYTGKIHKIGEVHEGEATMDTLKDERERGITIQSAATSCQWTKDDLTDPTKYTLNLIDTPGHVDFQIEVERSMRVLDGAIAVFDGKEGVEAQTESVWRQADKYKVPRICFVNKMDKVGADFEYTYNSMKKRLGVNAIPVQIPLGQADTFEAIIDLVSQEVYYFSKNDQGLTISYKFATDLGQSTPEYTNFLKWRQVLIEKLADLDDEIAEKYLDGKVNEINPEDIRRVLRKNTIEMKCFPVLCGSALKNVGVQKLLNAVVDYLPSPADLAPIEGVGYKDRKEKIVRPQTVEEPFCGLVFKIVNDEHGDLVYTRVYSGVLKKGTRVLNTTTGGKEIVSRIFQMNSNKKIALEEAKAGDIVAIVGMKNVKTGDTIADPDHPIILGRIDFPKPVVSVSVEVVKGGDQDKLSNALSTISREDPSFRFSFNQETNQTLMAGMGELHLDIIQTKLNRDLGIPIRVGKPFVAYKETITKEAEARGYHKKATGGKGQHGDVYITLVPYTQEQADEEGLDYEDEIAFENKVVGGTVPKEFVPSVEKGIRAAAKNGVLAGYPLLGFKAMLTDGSTHPVDSSPLAFELAAILALKDAARKASPALLEPIMKVTVTTPEEFMGSVLGTISSRRGFVQDTEQRGNAKILTAEVPLSEMFGYASELRGMSTGRASYDMELLTYREVPRNIAEKIISEK